MQTAESWLMIHRGMTDLESELYTPHNPDKDIYMLCISTWIACLAFKCLYYNMPYMNNDKTLTKT